MGAYVRFVLFAGLLGLTGVAGTESLSATDVMQQTYDQARLKKNQQSEVQMLIYQEEDSDKVRKRHFRTKFKVLGDRSKSLIRLYSPPAQKGIGLLSEVLDEKDRPDQWIYLPAFRSVRKINSQNRNDSFLGSDLTYADMAGRKPDQDDHRFISSEQDLWQIESVPKDAEDFYSRFVSHIHKKAMIAVQIDFYDSDGNLLKILKNKRIGKFDGMYVALQTEVNNVRTGGRTELTRSGVDVRSRIGTREVGIRGLESQE